MIHIHPLITLQHTPFGIAKDIQPLRDRGIAITDDPDKADLHAARRFPLSHHGRIASAAIALWKRPRKPLLVWCHEPRGCTLTERFYPKRGVYPPMHVMCIYTNDIFLTNLSMYGYNIDRPLTPLTEPPPLPTGGRPVVALTSYIRKEKYQRLIIHGQDIDLVNRRQRLIIEGWRQGIVDIFGPRWPKHMRLGESRRGAWQATKLELLKPYRFNVCLENTNWPGYCSEKIWDALRGYCLPIYHGQGNSIYDILPRDSFIDTADYDSNEALWNHVRNMADDEYLTRMNRCIEGYNAILASGEYERDHAAMLDHLAQRIRSIVEGGNAIE